MPPSRNDLKPLTRGGFPQSLIKTHKFKAGDLTARPDERSRQLQGIRCPQGMKLQNTRGLVANKITGSDFCPLAAQPQNHCRDCSSSSLVRTCSRRRRANAEYPSLNAPTRPQDYHLGGRGPEFFLFGVLSNRGEGEPSIPKLHLP
jgi:hypothetical protein